MIMNWSDDPQALALAGEGVRSLNVGEVWHFFEQELGYPVNLVNAEEFSYLPWKHSMWSS